MRRGGLKGMPAPPTRPFANAYQHGEGARAADKLIGAEGPSNPAPAIGLGGSTGADSIIGRNVAYNSPASVGKKKAHPGFKSAQSSIAKREGISKDRAGAILASASRGASKAAKKENPRLKRVKG